MLHLVTNTLCSAMFCRSTETKFIKTLIANSCAHGNFRCFELCSICSKEGLGRSKPATNPQNKHINTTFSHQNHSATNSTNLKDRSGANSVYSTNWTDGSEAKSVYSTNLKERSGANSVYSTNWTDGSEAKSVYTKRSEVCLFHKFEKSKRNELGLFQK
jgi:hypothetical protein